MYRCMSSQTRVFWHVKLLCHCIFTDVSKDHLILNFMVKKFKRNFSQALPLVESITIVRNVAKDTH